MMRRTIGGVLAGFAILLAGGAAWAEHAVAVLGIEPVAGAPVDTASQLATALKNQVLRTAGYRLVQAKNLDEVKLVFGCVDEQPACMARVGRSLQATKVLWGALRPSPTGYTVALRYLDVQSERIDKVVTGPLSRDEAAQPAETVARLTQSFLISALGTIKLRCNVLGAEVMLGAAVKGLTDDGPMLISDVAVGPQLLRIRKRGYRTWRQQISVAGGQTVAVEAEMQALVADGGVATPPLGGRGPVRRQRPRDDRTGWRVAFWSGAGVTVALGVLMGVTGMSVLGLEDDKKQEIERVIRDASLRAQLTAAAREELQTGNACGTAGQQRGDVLSGLSSICDDGNTRATMFNAMLGASAVTAIVSAYFLYKAYLAPRPYEADDDEQDAEASVAPPRWRLLSGIGPDGAQIGVSLSF